MSEQKEEKNNNLLLSDILVRMRDIDTRLDRIEGEIIGVKKAISIFMTVSKLVGIVVGIGIAIWKGLGYLIPKGRNGKNNKDKK